MTSVVAEKKREENKKKRKKNFAFQTIELIYLLFLYFVSSSNSRIIYGLGCFEDRTNVLPRTLNSRHLSYLRFVVLTCRPCYRAMDTKWLTVWSERWRRGSDGLRNTGRARTNLSIKRLYPRCASIGGGSKRVRYGRSALHQRNARLDSGTRGWHE